ncbi:hypothetical protein [Steroidobacter denitrificans]|uniref:hypothetical protein n=1 Tax=Steroidobacter denitrificans TaxID=465721 RepID=UPI0012EED714|nr:hypothetical protein [Steroidobacter denitrificans]
MDFGVWNYNPGALDPTQAYTNPLYAVLSIIPNRLGWDVVLFFKVLSSMLLLSFIYWFRRVARGSGLLAAAFVALPATVIHVYSGLETFLFVFLTAVLLVALYEHRIRTAILTTLVLFIVRPETWLLAALLPIYFLIDEPEVDLKEVLRKPFAYLRGLRFHPGRALGVLAAIALPLLGYLIFHRLHFGGALPNTFYAKHGVSFSVARFVEFGLYLAPLVGLLCLGRLKLAAFMAVFFGTIVLAYSTSNLQMNYAGRFAYHLFAPMYVFLVYLGSRAPGSVYLSTSADFIASYRIERGTLYKAAACVLLAMFAGTANGSRTQLAWAATYYPRALASHADLGKALQKVAAKYNLRAFSFGDAGMAAYHSKLNALDNVGVASAQVTRHGVNASVLDLYRPDLVALYATPAGVRLSEFGQQAIHDWTLSQGFRELCDIYWRKDYLLKLYARTDIDELLSVCADSKRANDKSDRLMLRNAILSPPWKYWTE